MIFNDYVVEINRQREYLKQIEFIVEELKNVLSLHEKWISVAFSSTYLRQIHSSSSGSANAANQLSDNTVKYFNELREAIIKIDFIDFGETLTSFKSVNIKGFDNKNKQIYDDFKKAYKIIHKYRGLTSVTERIDGYNEFINAVILMINFYDKFSFMVEYLNEINLGLNQGIENDNLEIRLLNESFEKETYEMVTEPIYIIYDKLCEIAHLTADKEPLKIVRMETGSFLVNFIGEKVILKIIGKILETAHNVYIRNYTSEGQKQNLVKSTDMVQKEFNVLKEMKECGLNVEEAMEISKETMTLIVKQSNILLSSSTDIRINKKVLSKSKDIKTLLESQKIISLPVENVIDK